METPQVPPSEAMPFRFRLWTRWSDEDAMGVLNNAVYLSLMEEARWRWCERLGLLAERHSFGFVLALARQRFVRPGRGPAEVEVELATLRLGGSSFQQAYRIRDAASGETWVEADAVLVTWDLAARAKTPLPERFRAAVREHEPGVEDAGSA